jgi:hypothetical protein
MIPYNNYWVIMSVNDVLSASYYDDDEFFVAHARWYNRADIGRRLKIRARIEKRTDCGKFRQTNSATVLSHDPETSLTFVRVNSVPH